MCILPEGKWNKALKISSLFPHTMFWWILSVTISPSTTVMLKMKSRKSGRYKPLPVSHLILQLSEEKQSFQGLPENCFETHGNDERRVGILRFDHPKIIWSIKCSSKSNLSDAVAKWVEVVEVIVRQRKERESVRFFHTIYRIQMMGTKIVHISTAHLLNFSSSAILTKNWTKSIFCRFCRVDPFVSTSMNKNFTFKSTANQIGDWIFGLLLS